MARGTAQGHVVWDWNGTLLDDFPLVVEAVNRSIARFGVDPITAEQYRDHYTRPVRRFYDSLFERDVADAEWDALNGGFHDHYFTLAESAELAADAHAAMDLFEEAGWTQSVLSMAPHHWVVDATARLGVAARLTRVEGMTGPMGGQKAPFMQRHIVELGVTPARTAAIGDTPDDANAAHSAGATAVLLDSGSHHAGELEAVGVPVETTLLGAARALLARPERPPRAARFGPPNRNGEVGRQPLAPS